MHDIALLYGVHNTQDELYFTRNMRQSIFLLDVSLKILKSCESGLIKKEQFNNYFGGGKEEEKKMSEVGFEPTPTFVDYDLNVAP